MSQSFSSLYWKLLCNHIGAVDGSARGRLFDVRDNNIDANKNDNILFSVTNCEGKALPPLSVTSIYQLSTKMWLIWLVPRRSQLAHGWCIKGQSVRCSISLVHPPFRCWWKVSCEYFVYPVYCCLHIASSKSKHMDGQLIWIALTSHHLHYRYPMLAMRMTNWKGNCQTFSWTSYIVQYRGTS